MCQTRPGGGGGSARLSSSWPFRSSPAGPHCQWTHPPTDSRAMLHCSFLFACKLLQLGKGSPSFMAAAEPTCDPTKSYRFIASYFRRLHGSAPRTRLPHNRLCQLPVISHLAAYYTSVTSASLAKYQVGRPFCDNAASAHDIAPSSSRDDPNRWARTRTRRPCSAELTSMFCRGAVGPDLNPSF